LSALLDNKNWTRRLASNFFNPFPKYLQVREILLHRLAREFSPGDSFPTEHALSEEFGVSRETVREAMRGLEQDQLIERKAGRGTVVLRRPKVGSKKRLTGLVEDFTAFKLDTTTRILDNRVIPAPPDIAEDLNVPEDEQIYLIKRLRILDSEPLALHEAYLPLDIGVRLARVDLRNTTISHEMRNSLGIDMQEDFQHLDAVVADPQLASQLMVRVGAPLLVIRRLYIDVNGDPVVFFQSHFRSDRYYYTLKLPHPPRRQTRSEKETIAVRFKGKERVHLRAAN
jgi:GntR family transcriptional regulator